MKKLKELKEEELKALYDNNSDFQQTILDRIYEDNMYIQSEEYKNMGADALEYNDYYSSFYLSTPRVCGAKAPEKVAGKLDADYMTEENGKKYKKLCELIEKWENMTEDEQESDAGEALYNEACDACDELADGLTAQFREFENVEDGQEYSIFELITDGGDYMSNWETDGEKVFEHITKVYK